MANERSNAWRWPIALASSLCVASFACGFGGAASAQEVVQALPNPATQTLSDALRRLELNPESLPALLDAGRSSLELDDVDAAESFLARARAVAPNDDRVLTGLAIVALRQGDAIAALDLFERADGNGGSLEAQAADRGLAYDLIGDNQRAQQMYGIALARGESAETVRRLALSYAIAGDLEASEATLLPLLQRRDLPAYRARAFALAIHSKQDEAISIAETLLPAQLARRLAPYLRYMPRLTRAQQAAAANLGDFPAVSDIGREDPRFAERRGGSAPVVSRATPDARLVPSGEPLAPVPAPDPVPAPAPAFEGPVLADAAQAAPVQEPSPPPAADFPPPAEAPGPSFTLNELADDLPGTSLETNPRQGAELADAFADLSLADDEEAAAAPGAVDITRIEPPRDEPAPPPPPAHPSRHWVQIATGQDVSAFRFDWRRLARNAGGLLEGREPWRAAWNSTNRLLTGPFASASEAQDFVTALGQEGVSAFRFTSAQGEEVVRVQ